MTIFQRVDSILEKYGFTAGPVRRVASFALILSTGILLAGIAAIPLIPWLLWTGVGAVLGAWNFISLAYFIQLIFNKNSKSQQISGKIKLTQLFGTNLRLFITGFLVYVSVVRFSANVFALTGGLFITVLLIPVLALGIRET